MLIIKYEDLVKNIHQEIDKIIAFLKNFIDFEVSDTKKKNIIKSTSFEALKKIENNGNFTENVFVKGKSEKVRFFNKGPSNVWQNTLPKDIQKELETELNSELKEFIDCVLSRKRPLTDDKEAVKVQTVMDMIDKKILENKVDL